MTTRREAAYTHICDTWATLFRRQIIRHIVDGEHVLLQAEIILETGCMVSAAMI